MKKLLKKQKKKKIEKRCYGDLVFYAELLKNVNCDEQFIWGLGVSPDEAECFDVYGLDEDLLAMVPQPVLAVLFLYPITKKVNLHIENFLIKLGFTNGISLQPQILA